MTITRTFRDVAANMLHAGDVLVARDRNDDTWTVTDVRTEGGHRSANGRLYGARTVIATITQTWTVDADLLVHVLDVDECDGPCVDGTWHGRGYVENGTFRGQTGECFRCRGKGHQTRTDRIRNARYDAEQTRAYN